MPGCKHVYFFCKVGHFNIGVYGDGHAFGDILEWPLEELQFLGLPCWLLDITEHIMGYIERGAVYQLYQPALLPWYPNAHTLDPDVK